MKLVRSEVNRIEAIIYVVHLQLSTIQDGFIIEEAKHGQNRHPVNVEEKRRQSFRLFSLRYCDLSMITCLHSSLLRICFFITSMKLCMIVPGQFLTLCTNIL